MKSYAKRISALLLLILLATLLPTALAEGIQATVKPEGGKVYAVSAPYTYLGTLPGGTAVTVEKYNRTVAQIRYNGYAALMLVADLKAAQTAQSAQTAQAPTVQTMSRSVVAVRDARVYAQPSASSGSVMVQAGTALTLVAISGGVAKVERGGQSGYMRLDDLGEPGSVPQQTAAQEAQTIDWSNKAVVTNQSTKIYARASTSSASWDAPAGTALSLVASKGGVALVERGGQRGYMLLSHLSDAAQVVASPAQTTVYVAQTEYVGSSNKDLIYKYLVQVMGLNHAAACGVLANIKYESGFSPACTGDGNTSYGIVQWHASRKSALISWCEENNLDYTTLGAQLRYFEYELQNKYPSVYRYLKNVENSKQGAYDAGYHFCYYYEAPSNRASKSDTRGAYARDTLY